jgi:DNA-binding Xre family transcriptional regulator
MNEKHIGSDFDEFLSEEGILEETEIVAVKRVLAFQITQLMQEQKISKVEMARKMKTSRAALDRLLDPENNSVTLNTMDKAARSLGKHLQLVIT